MGKQWKKLLMLVMMLVCLPTLKASVSAEATIQCMVYVVDTYGDYIDDFDNQTRMIYLRNDDNSYQMRCEIGQSSLGMGLAYTYGAAAGNYTITAEPVEGYDVQIADEDDYEITTLDVEGNGYYSVSVYYTKQETTSVSATIEWNDGNGQYGMRPESLTVSLMKEGVTVDTKEITAADDWKAEFSDLLKFDDSGREIIYTVSGAPVDGYVTTQVGNTITYTYQPSTDGETGATDSSGSATLTDSDKSKDIAVYGRYTERALSAPVISVEVAWDSMEFIFAAEQQGTWNPGTHKYDSAKTEAGWVNDKSNIEVTNHSNVPVKASFKFDPTEGSVTGGFRNDGGDVTYVELNAGVENEPANADHKTVEFAIGGFLGSSVDTANGIGTITVSVEENKA